MREIKFRAWDKINKRMLFSLGDTEGTWWYPFGFEMNSKYFQKRSYSYNCILMQYTGLKDKNGKEIYEGDIVRHKDAPLEICTVIWDGGGFYARSNIEDMFYSLTNKVLIEVIGNIYENPELLKENE